MLLALLALPLGGCLYPRGWEVATQGPDPYEGSNRAVFGFNEGVDHYVLAPVAHGWAFITPEGLRVAMDRFFRNLGFPARLLANLGQGKLAGAGRETGRFLVNTTVGLLGFFDPARAMGLEPSDEDFGQMFGVWGIPRGPYWVVPLLGPSDPRDFTGGIFDSLLDVRTLLFGVVGVGTGVTVVETVNTRALLDAQIEAAKEGALDYYLFVRDGYLERRRILVHDLQGNGEWQEEAPAYDDSLYEIETGIEKEPDAGGAEKGEAPAPEAPAPEEGSDAQTQ